jgi:Putative restriction endonuclease
MTLASPAGGVPEHWIVDTAHERVEVHSDIVEGHYGRVAPYTRAGVIGSAAMSGLWLSVRVDDIFA